jgi:hypothetical protein
MDKATIAGCPAVLLILLLVAPVLATPTIDVGTHYLLPNTQKMIPIMVSTSLQNPDMVRALDFSIQVGDGGPINSYGQVQGTDTMPKITAVDIIGPGTLFYQPGGTQDTYHLPDSGGTYLIWQAETELPAAQPYRAAQGTLAYVTVDTTGAAPGLSRQLSLNNVAAEYLMNFPPVIPGFVTNFGGTNDAIINNGQLVVVPLHTMTWTGIAGNWKDSTWTPNTAPPFPNYTADAVVTSQTAVVDINAAREANSLTVGSGQVTITAAPGSLHVTTNVNLNPGGTLAIDAGGTLTGETSSAIQMSGGRLSGSGGMVAITLPVSVTAGITNSLTTPGTGDTLNLNAPLSISGSGTTLNKDGAGILNIPAGFTRTFDPGTVFNANAGSTNIASSTGTNLTANASGGTLNFNSVAQTLAGLGLSNGGIANANMNLTDAATTVGAGGGTLFVDTAKTVTTGTFSVAGGATLIKTGPGTLIIDGPQNHLDGAVLQIGGPGSPSPLPLAPLGFQGVPEPSTFALLAIGALALLLWRHRR